MLAALADIATLYTMASERAVHATFLPAGTAAAPPPPPPASDDDLFDDAFF